VAEGRKEECNEQLTRKEQEWTKMEDSEELIVTVRDLWLGRMFCCQCCYTFKHLLVTQVLLMYRSC
jgi:hypothetical protein